MKAELQNKCELFTANKKVLTKFFALSSPYVYPVSANILSSKNVAADKEKLKACQKILADRTGFFSAFRGTVSLPVTCMLTLEANPEDKMDRIMSLYSELKEQFMVSDFLPLIAVLLADRVPGDDAERFITRGKEIYKLMKKEHPFLTGSEDSVFAVLLAFSKKSNEQLISDMEQIFAELKDDGFNKDSTQTVSHIFALSEGDYLEKCAKLRKMIELIKLKGRKYGKTYEMGVLAGLAILPADAETLVDEMMEIDEYLSTDKDYGFFGFDKHTRLMHSAMILSGEYADADENKETEVSALAGTIAIVAVEEAALYGAIIAGAAAGSHASGSSK